MEALSPHRGAVTFLDVLGWQGIWAREQNALEVLQNLIKTVIEDSDNISNRLLNGSRVNKGATTKVLSVSDTIVIFTSGSPSHAIKTQAEICSMAIPESIKKRLPLRGAISYGEFSSHNNIMVGPAVDEAARWHVFTDWIGVVLAPSGEFQLKGVYPKPLIAYPDIPFKKKTCGLNGCVAWEFPSDELYELFTEMGPFSPEIAPKYLNTLEYLRWKDNVAQYDA